MSTPVKKSPVISTKPEHHAVCAEAANMWLKCLEPFADGKRAGSSHTLVWTDCAAERADFDRCVVDWRRSIGEDPASPNITKVRSKESGVGPSQCCAFSCTAERCLATTNYNFEKCKLFLQSFKHCVTALYGEPYVVD